MDDLGLAIMLILSLKDAFVATGIELSTGRKFYHQMPRELPATIIALEPSFDTASVQITVALHKNNDAFYMKGF